MTHWEGIFGTMVKTHQFVTIQDDVDKVVVYERGELLYVFNFHPVNSYTDYLIGTHWRSDLMILFETDEHRFGGHERLNEGRNKWYKVSDKSWKGRRHSF
jgi:1,4-alpha-glucan branching enzyme